MGRLVWFGVCALSPAGAVATLTVGAAALAGAGYYCGQGTKKKKKRK